MVEILASLANYRKRGSGLITEMPDKSVLVLIHTVVLHSFLEFERSSANIYKGFLINLRANNPLAHCHRALECAFETRLMPLEVHFEFDSCY